MYAIAQIKVVCFMDHHGYLIELHHFVAGLEEIQKHKQTSKQANIFMQF